MNQDLTPPEFAPILQTPRPDPENVLRTTECVIPDLLRARNRWRSLFIDYEKPHLMRLYVQLGAVRISLHYFLPARKEDLSNGEEFDANLYHPHPWWSVMRILEGRYRQWFGVASEVLRTRDSEEQKLAKTPVRAILVEQVPGSFYAMTHPFAWHQVLPVPDQAVSTLMVTVIPKGWSQRDLPPPVRQRELTSQERSFMFSHFKRFY
ncbi:MAG: hypothetical protein WBX25_30380 [Rhodomicrobium sp.]